MQLTELHFLWLTQMDPGPSPPPTFVALMEIELRLVATDVIWVPELLGAAPANADGARGHRQAPSLEMRNCTSHVAADGDWLLRGMLTAVAQIRRVPA